MTGDVHLDVEDLLHLVRRLGVGPVRYLGVRGYHPLIASLADTGELRTTGPGPSHPLAYPRPPRGRSRCLGMLPGC